MRLVAVQPVSARGAAASAATRGDERFALPPANGAAASAGALRSIRGRSVPHGRAKPLRRPRSRSRAGRTARRGARSGARAPGGRRSPEGWAAARQRGGRGSRSGGMTPAAVQRPASLSGECRTRTRRLRPRWGLRFGLSRHAVRLPPQGHCARSRGGLSPTAAQSPCVGPAAARRPRPNRGTWRALAGQAPLGGTRSRRSRPASCSTALLTSRPTMCRAQPNLFRLSSY